MKSLLNYTPTQSTAILLVGSPGTGKTTAALQFPAPYIFDADNNLGGPVRYLKTQDGGIGGIKYNLAIVDDEGKTVTPFQRWTHMVSCLKQAAADPEVKTIIVDSLTTIQEIIKDDIFRQRVPQPGNKTPIITEANRTKGQLTEPEWGVYARYFNELVTSLKATGKIIIFTAHDEMRQPGDSQMWMNTIALEGQMRFKFAGLFSDVINVVVKQEGFGDNQKTVRYYRTIPTMETDKRGLKTSFLLPGIFNSMEELFKKINEEQNNEH